MSYPVGSVRLDRSSTILRALYWLAMIVATAWLLWGVIIPASHRQSPGFSSAYTSARLVLLHEFGPHVYDSAWFQIMERRLGLEDGSYGIQSPPMALLLTPIAWLQPSVAHTVWLLLDVIWIFGIAGVTMAVAYQAGTPMNLASLAITTILLAIYPPLHADLADAQVNTLLALISAIWLFGYAGEHNRLCGLSLALLTLLNPAWLLLWLVLLASRRWRALAWAGGGVLAGFLLTLPLLGLASWWVYVMGGMAALVSVLSQHWFGTLVWLAAVGVLCRLSSTYLLSEMRLLMAAAALCLIAPLHLSGELYSNVIMMPPLLLALLLVAPQPQGAPLAIALGGLALLLLAVPTDFLNTHSWSRWAFLIPIRMYGALSLWGAFITLRRAGLAPVAAQA